MERWNGPRGFGAGKYTCLRLCSNILVIILAHCILPRELEEYYYGYSDINIWWHQIAKDCQGRATPWLYHLNSKGPVVGYIYR